MEQDRVRWDPRHAQRPDPTPAAPELVAARPALLAELPVAGRALDVACGTGGQTLWLAQRGLAVIAVDVSPVAIDRLRDAARRVGVAHRVDARVHDTDDGLPAGEFDVVVCQRYRVVELYAALEGALAPGGLLLLTVLSERDVGGDDGPFRAAPDELRTAYAGREIIADVERDGVASIAVRRPLN